MRYAQMLVSAAIAAAALVAAPASAVGPGEGAVLTVPGTAPTIQAAIDLAADGAIVEVSPGVYRELIDLRGRAITVRAMSPDPADTVIDGTGLDGSVVTFVSGEGPDTVVEGFTITGGAGTEDRTDRRSGGGVYISGAGPTVRRCILLDNRLSGRVDRGGGIFARRGEPVIVGCVFDGNAAGKRGGGLDATSAIVVNCVFERNVARNAAGARLRRGLVANSVFRDNTAGRRAGGLAPGRATVAHCTFHGNVADAGGSLRGGSGLVVNSILWDRSAIGSFRGTVTHCAVRGGHPGHGNISIHPRFVDAAAGDLRLRRTSPCIDAGHTWLAPADVVDLNGNGDTTELLPLDLDSGRRCLDGPLRDAPGLGCGPVTQAGATMFVDMGAYEHGSAGHDPGPRIYNFLYTDDQRGRTAHLTGQGPITDGVIAGIGGVKIPMVYGHFIDFDGDATPLEDAAGTAGTSTGEDTRFANRLDAIVEPIHDIGCLDWEVPFRDLDDGDIDPDELDGILAEYDAVVRRARALKPGRRWGHYGLPRSDRARAPGYLDTYAAQWAPFAASVDVLYPAIYDIIPEVTVEEHVAVVRAFLELAARYNPGAEIIPIFNVRVTGGHPGHRGWIEYDRAVEVAVAVSRVRVQGRGIAGWGLWDAYIWSTQETLDDESRIEDQAEYDARTEFLDRRHAEIFRRVSRALTSGVRPGDTDGNGTVDDSDLLHVLDAWGPCRWECCRADLDADGSVGEADLRIVLANRSP
ncbi:MAG: hypothetical protein ACYTG1_04485 [Planctomycetota bacterium]|jgi:hypothetical protein